MIHRILSRIAYGIPFFLVAGILTEFLLTNYLAGLGKEVRIIDERIAEIQEENQRLVGAVASSSSLLTVAARAKELGFVEPIEFLTIGADRFPFALKVR